MGSDGMLLPPLCTQAGYVQFAEGAGLKTVAGPKDISKDVSKTWYAGFLFGYVGEIMANFVLLQGYIVVARAESLALGICTQPRSGWHRFLAVLPGDAAGIREWSL